MALEVAPVDHKKVEFGLLVFAVSVSVPPAQTWVLLAVMLTTGAWAQANTLKVKPNSSV